MLRAVKNGEHLRLGQSFVACHNFYLKRGSVFWVCSLLLPHI